jgi:hypothetical protein
VSDNATQPLINLLPIAARQSGGALTPLNVLLRLDDAAERWPSYIVTTADGTRFEAAALVRDELARFAWVVEGAGQPQTLDLTNSGQLTPGLKGALTRALSEGIGWTVVQG